MLADDDDDDDGNDGDGDTQLAISFSEQQWPDEAHFEMLLRTRYENIAQWVKATQKALPSAEMRERAQSLAIMPGDRENIDTPSFRLIEDVPVEEGNEDEDGEEEQEGGGVDEKDADKKVHPSKRVGRRGSVGVIYKDGDDDDDDSKSWVQCEKCDKWHTMPDGMSEWLGYFECKTNNWSKRKADRKCTVIPKSGR
jgi:hypothetical protein